MNEFITLLHSWYSDPMFLKLPVFTMALGLVSFLVLALPWTILAWFDPDWAKPYKTQQKPFAVNSYLGRNLYLIAINSSIVFMLLILAWPLLMHTGIHDGPSPEWYTYIWQLGLFIFLDDFLYYWMHRSMHENKWLLKNVHSVHHQVRNPSAIAGNYFHWIELALTAGLALLGPIILSSHIYVVYAWFIWRQWEAVDGHTGYTFKWNPMALFPFYHGAAFHDAHHEHYKGNYAGFLPIWDKWFKTQTNIK